MAARASHVRAAADRSGESSSASAAPFSARRNRCCPGLRGQQLLEARRRAERPNHGESECLGPPQLTCNPLEAVGSNAVHDLEHLVHAENLASQELLTAKPRGDCARVL